MSEIFCSKWQNVKKKKIKLDANYVHIWKYQQMELLTQWKLFAASKTENNNKNAENTMHHCTQPVNIDDYQW